MPGQPLREVLSLFGFKLDKKSWGQANAAVNKMRSGLLMLGRLALGGGGVYAFKRLTDATVELGDDIDKTSKRLGINAQALQELRHVANLAGVSSGSLSQAFGLLQKNAYQAQRGSAEMAEAFQRLGVRVTNAGGDLRSSDELFMEVSDRLAGMKNETQRTALAMTLLGRSGKDLVPLMAQGSDAIREQMQEARALGGVMSQEAIKAAVDYKDEMTRLKFALAGLRNAVFAKLLPGMLDAAKAMKEWIARNKEWLSTNISKALEIAGKALQRTGQFAQFMFRGIKRIGEWIGPLNSGLVKMAGIIGLISLLFGVWPVIAIAAFLAIEDIVSFFEGKKSVTGQIVEWLRELHSQLAEQPFDADNVWYVTVFQAIAKAGQAMLDVLDAILERLAGPIGDLLYGRGGVSLEKIGNVAGALPGAKALGSVFTEAPGAEAVGNAVMSAAKAFRRAASRIPGAEALGNLFVSSAAGAIRQGMNRPASRLAGQPQARQSNVTIQQTINPPAGTSSAEVADMSGRKAAEGVSAAERREAMRVFAPQVAD